MMTTTCITCGSLVRVVSDEREGTSHYEPIPPALTEAERAVVEAAIAWASGTDFSLDDPTPYLLDDACRALRAARAAATETV